MKRTKTDAAIDRLPRSMGEPYERILVVVGWRLGQGKDRFILQSEVSADMGIEPPSPPISVAEMQDVCYAAKQALWKVLRDRTKKQRKGQLKHGT